jgi:hypothetical protein
MKTTFYTLMVAMCLSLTAIAQNSIPNGNFESWNIQAYQMPQFAIQTSNTEAFFKADAPFNCVQTSDAYHGSFAIKLTTEVTATDAVPGYFIDGNPQNGNPSTWTGGIPCNQKATGIRGYYKSSIAAGDTGLIILDFKKAGSSVGTYELKLYGTHTAYTQFAFTLSPALTVTPDTLIFGAVSSDILNNIALNNSMLELDSISLTGVASQPAELNGDFESWESQNVSSLPDWYVQGNGEGAGVAQTSDAEKGTYAAELTTFLGNQNNLPIASAAQISTGFWNCPQGGGQCVEEGGYPFSNQIDTLAFYYKYTPSGNDSAEVNLNFKSGGTQIWGTGMNLGASANYKYVEIPFNTQSAPDSVVVQFQSSSWQDTSLSFVGSDLKIDNVFFKSQALTGVKQLTKAGQINIYPNPSTTGKFNISNVNPDDLIRVFNVFGTEQNITFVNENTSKINLTNVADGVYFVQVQSRGAVTTQKVIVKR